MKPTISSLEAFMSGVSNGLQNYEREMAARSGTQEALPAAAEYAKNPDALHGDTPPVFTHGEEKPIHVLMCYMQAAGKSNKEIALATDHSYNSVCQITKQPWFRKRFLRLVAEAGMDQVEGFVKGETINSLETLVEVRDAAASSPTARIAAANSILDRALGKPAVYVKNETSLTMGTAATSKDEIEKGIADIQKELQSRGISITPVTNERN